jgi:serine phosphatase RsbU (regulator of sigma subunit)
MKIRPNGGPWSGWAWARPALPLVVLLAVAVVRLLAGPGHGLLPLLAVAPATAAALGGPLYTTAVGAAAIGTEALLTDGFRTEAVSHQQIRIALVVIVGVSAGGVAASYVRRRRERELTEVREVAEVKADVLLRPIPRQVGPVRLSARYTSASSQAHVGGDLYAEVATASGLRLIVGDAEGKGLPAVHMAATAMYAFRLAAHEEDKLSAVAARIEAALKHELGEEQFITAILAEVSQDCRELTMLNCGHPQPLLLGQQGPELLVLADIGLPLGMGLLAADQREPFTIPWEAGDPILFYTDGLTEARDRTGTFFPLTESESIRDHPDPETLLDRLSAEVSSYTSHQRHDDMALLLIWSRDS